MFAATGASNYRTLNQARASNSFVCGRFRKRPAKSKTIMDTPQLSQLNVASLPLPDVGIAAVRIPELELTLRPDFAPFTVPTPTPPPSGRLPITTPAAPSAPWHLPATIGPVLANSLRSRWKSYRARLQGCQDDFSEETVHELRVAARRLIAQFVMLGCLSPGTTAEKARRVLKRQLKAFGELRDTQVQLLFLERQVVRFPELIVVLDFLRCRERRLERAAAAKVKNFKTRKLGKWTRSLGEHLARNPARARHPDGLATTVARATDKAFADVVRRRQAIEPSNPGTIHRTRVAFKKFRYMVESLSSDFTGLSKRDLRAMARYQRRMGLLQDLEVMQGSITGFVQKHKGMEALLRPFARHLQAGRVRARRSFLKSADELFVFWPPRRATTNADSAARRAVA